MLLKICSVIVINLKANVLASRHVDKSLVVHLGSGGFTVVADWIAICFMHLQFKIKVSLKFGRNSA